MLAEDLKIAKTVKELLWVLITLRNDLPRQVRNVLGDRMINCLENILGHISYANRTKGQERLKYLTALLAEYGQLEFYICFCMEHKLISGVKRAAQISMLAASVGKQASGWKGSTERSMSSNSERKTNR